MAKFNANKEAFQELLIKCPHCGAEYLPAEIYYPDEFLGKPQDINKVHNTGALDYYRGKSMNTQEEYVCDYCGTRFYVDATVSFKTSIDKLTNMASNYKTVFKKSELF